MELIFLMHALGRMNAEDQKVVMPDITVLIRRRRPEKDRDFTDQAENRDFTC